MQINLTGFLNGKYARVFMGELWSMLDSAQNSPNGIPKDLVSQKMAEIGARKGEDGRMAERLRKLADQMGAEAEAMGPGGQARSRSNSREAERRMQRERRRRSRSRSRSGDRKRRSETP